MALNPDERVKIHIGDLVFQLAIAQSTIEAQDATIKELNTKLAQAGVAGETNSQPPSETKTE